jgi:hypothetical protein
MMTAEFLPDTAPWSGAWPNRQDAGRIVEARSTDGGMHAGTLTATDTIPGEDAESPLFGLRLASGELEPLGSTRPAILPRTTSALAEPKGAGHRRRRSTVRANVVACVSPGRPNNGTLRHIPWVITVSRQIRQIARGSLTGGVAPPPLSVPFSIPQNNRDTVTGGEARWRHRWHLPGRGTNFGGHGLS